MTVEEAIEFLSGFPEDAIVQINNSDGGITNIIEATYCYEDEDGNPVFDVC